MRILLIGGNGFIGSLLVNELRRSGHELAIFHRRPFAGSANSEALQILGDRNRLSDSLDAIKRFSPQAIIDLILSSGDQAQKLMRVARELHTRVVAISSMDVYRAWGILQAVEPGPLEPLPITEESALRSGRALYSPEAIKMMQKIFTWVNERYDKIAVEEEIMREAHVSATIMRLPMVYGPGDPLHRFFPLLKRLADGRTTILLPDDFAAWRGPRGYVENVAHAIALAATRDQAAGRIYHVCEEPILSELEWQKLITQTIDRSCDFIVLDKQRTPKHLLVPGNLAQHVVATSERIRTELHYQEPVPVAEAIRRTVSWEQRNPPATVNPQQLDYRAEDAALANVL
jgi:nucleoside-diphosphate-sugar epimerase